MFFSEKIEGFFLIFSCISPFVLLFILTKTPNICYNAI